MLEKHHKIAIYMDGYLGSPEGKMGDGILKYSSHQIVAVIDGTHQGKNLQEFVACKRQCPIVKDITTAKTLGADVLALGVSPSGGHIPKRWYQPLDKAITLGFSIINGLHERLSLRYQHLSPTQWIWDVRQEPLNLPIASAQAKLLNNKRILFVGTDMAIGKMTSALELFHAAQAENINAKFIATGQIGIIISGTGIPLDAIRVDYAAGAVEKAVLKAKDAELIFIEGQGAINHPGSTSTLPLMRGSCPTHLILCHRAGQTHLALNTLPIPPLQDLIHLYEAIASTCNLFTQPKVMAVCLNTAHLNDEKAKIEIDKLANALQLPVFDLVRHGAQTLLTQIQRGV